MIIDSHTHIGYESDTQKQEPKELLKMMDVAGVDKSVVFPFGPPHSHDQSYREENKNIAQQKSNQRFIVFGRVNQLSKDMISEVERINSLGLKGIKMHTHRAPLKNLDPLFKELNKFDLPLIVHTGHNENSHVETLKDIPFNGNVIIGHGGKDNYMKAIELVNSRDNFFIETSLLSLRRTSQVIEKVKDKSKILFGSDAPYHHPDLEVKKIYYACDDKQLAKDILGNNLKRII
tara:strand:- start:7313 stop:8011 length:699 start_codon:yes stop_codon:yes gene_type:complete